MSDKARNLDLYLGTKLRFKEHVLKIIRYGYSHLKIVYENRDCLDAGLRKALCELLALFSIDKLRIQRIQNVTLLLDRLVG